MNYTKAQYIELFGEEAYKEYIAKKNEQYKKYRERNPEAVRAIVRKSSRKHSVKHNAHVKKYFAECRQEDPVFSYLESLRTLNTRYRHIIPNKPFDEYVMEVLIAEEPSLLDTEEMYKWFQDDINSNLTFGIFRILKNFVWLMKIKIYKDEELTEHEKEMWKYFATAKYNIKAPKTFFNFKATLVRVPPEYLTTEALKNGKLKLYWELDEMFKRAKGLTTDE